MRATVARIGHVGLAVRDLDVAVAFYTEVLGLTLTERFVYPEEDVGHGSRVAAGAFVRCDANHHCISLFSLKGGADEATAPSAYGLHHLAFELTTPEELLGKYRELRALGVPIVSARRGGPGNQPRFYAHDPDGNLLEFYWAIDQIGWQGAPRAYPPIEEIELEQFDFAAYIAERDRAAAAMER
jgi:catechol 2,3-dioxygenase-like lactoylglutathione lyase family enzyme